MEADNAKFSVTGRFGLEQLSTIRGVGHVSRPNYSVKAFCNALAWLHHLYLKRFYQSKKVLEHRLGSDTLEEN